MDIKKPDLVDIFKEEYHIEKPAVEESTEMMRRRLDKKTIQHEKDKEEFYKYYNAWWKIAQLYSNLRLSENNPNYLSIIKMGKRAVPFIYEQALTEGFLLIDALEKIYGESVIAPGEEITDESVSYHRWMKKLQEEFGL